MGGTTSTWEFANLLLVLSNVAFLLPAIPCFRAKKYVAGTLFICTCIASSVYHTCKWGSADKKGFGGHCVTGLTFEMTYAMDFFFSQMSVAITAGFFINPKTILCNIEERYKKSLKSHRNIRNHQKSSKCRPHHYYVLKFANHHVLSNIYPSQQELPPWILCYYDIEDQSLTVLKAISNNLSAPSHQPNVDAPNNNNNRLGLGGDKIESGEPEIWCKTCNQKVLDYGMREKGLGITSSSFSHEGKAKCHRIGYLDKYYYCDAGPEVKQKLNYLESFYILFHVFVISLAIKLVGPSFYNLTVPLILYNVLVIFLLLWVSYLTQVRLYLKRKLCKDYLLLLNRESKTGAIFFCEEGDIGKISYDNQVSPNQAPKFFSRHCNKMGRTLWYLFHDKENDHVHVKRIIKILPKGSLLGVDVLKSMEWAFGIHRLQHKSDRETNGYNNTLYTDVLTYKKMYLLVSMLMALVAILLFATQNIQPQSIYSWTHSAWHVLGPLGQYIIFDLVL